MLTLKQIVACGLFLAIVIATTLIIESFAISVVTNAFHQQSQIAWFNDFFSRQPTRPLGIYVSVAQTRIRFYAGAIACITALAYFLLNPRFQQYCDSRFNCVEPKTISFHVSDTTHDRFVFFSTNSWPRSIRYTFLRGALAILAIRYVFV